jgi:D-glycero-D-manno-heptose 1,7-bisphosphate phosphatase
MASRKIADAVDGGIANLRVQQLEFTPMETDTRSAIIRSMPEGSGAIPFPHVRYVFLDRDGVINRKPPEGQYVYRWSDFHLLPGAETAIARLNRSGYKVIIVTNQRGVALGLYTEQAILQLHDQLRKHLALYDAQIDSIYYCPHDKNECNCRKPGPGLFEQAFHDFPDASIDNSIVIGDSLSDIEAGVRLSMPAIFIQGDPQHRKPGAEGAASLATAVADSLLEAVDRYLPSMPIRER